MKLNETPAHYAQIEDEVDGKPWYYDIRLYIKSQQYLEHAFENDKRILRKLTTNFLLDGEILYKKGKDQILLRCVDAPKAQCIIVEVHKGYVERMLMDTRWLNNYESWLLLVDFGK